MPEQTLQAQEKMETVDTLILGGYLVTVDEADREYPDGALAIRDGRLVAVGPTAEIAHRYEASNVINASGKCIFPGLVNTHTHLFQTFMKGLGEGIHVHEWLKVVTTPGILQMEPDDFYLSAMVGCMEAIRSGTTTLVEYMYPNPRHEMGDAVLEALVDSGVRALLGRSVADIGDNDGYPVTAYYADLLEPLDEALQDCARLVRACRDRGEGRVTFCLAPPNMRCVEPETFAVFQEFARAHNCIITMHTCETARDDEIIGARHGLRAIEWLEGLGFLASNFLAVHCVHLIEDGIRRFARNDVRVSYNPVSNMYLGNGVAPVARLLEEGVIVSLGVDGASSNNSQNMLEALKMGVLLQRAATQNPGVMSSRDALHMATIDGARAIGMAHEIGSLEVGKRADVLIADFYQPISAPYYNPVSTLAFSSSPQVVDTVLVGGRVVLQDGQFTALNERELILRAQQAGRRLALRSYGPQVLELCPAIAAP